LLPLAGLQLMPIRETLLVRLLIIENPSPKSTAAIAADEEKNQIRLLDSQTLQELKQRLTVTQLPDRRAQEIDQMIVIGQPVLLADEHDEIGVLNTILPRPDIRIEGYMPIRTVAPIYPRHALAQGIEGEVTVRFTIAANGAVVEPEVIAATPRRVFDRAVLTALREWHYQPQMIDGNPVILQGVSEKFTFQLDPPVSSPRRR
jgi:bla regulator protein BlaR1